MELLGRLGIDIKLLIAQIINFSVLMWILSKYVYKPIIKRIEKNEKELNKLELEKTQLESEKSKFEEQKKRQQSKTSQQSREIIREAEEIAQKIKIHAQKEAKKEKEAVIDQIKTRLSEIENAAKNSH